MVKETCELALDLTKWREETEDGKTEGLDLKSKQFQGSEPSPPFNIDADPKFRDISYLT